MKKERKLVKEIEAKRNNENKGVVKMMEKERKEERKEEVKGNKGGIKMNESKELIEEIEAKKGLLMEKVLQWALKLQPVRDVHIKIKGRYYPLLGKETGKIYLIDKVKGKKVPFDTLEDKNMKFVILSVLAERKEEIEKEVQEEKKKYLQKKLNEIENLLNKF